MTDLTDRLVVKSGNVFAVVPREGAWEGADGVWMDDCRYLAEHRLRIGGAVPRVVRTEEHDDLTVHHFAGGDRLERRVHADGTMDERVVADGEIELEIGADFISVFALRGIIPAGAPPAGLRAVGRDGVERATHLALDYGTPGELRAHYRFSPARLQARATFELPEVRCDDERFSALLDRALRDARMLLSTLDGHPYFAAGIPWYATLFGRDSLIAALQLLPLAPDVAAGTLRLLADRIGATEDPLRAEEPGKILHELRVGEASESPLARYYGSVDSTPLFLIALAEHHHWTGDDALQRDLAPAAQAARDWIARRDPLTYTAGALRHQGWKDSEDGVPVGPTVALVEPQGYAGRDVEPFWLPDRGFYAMALGTDVLASNQGHLLWAGRITAERAQAIRDAVMSPAMFSGWGIRTLGEGEPGYDPLGYHLGTVWPHDTALIAAGLRRHGYDRDFLALFEALIDAAEAAPGGRLPELLGGHPREPGRSFVPYTVACRPQAWAAGAIPFLAIEALGLRDGRPPLLPSGVGHLEFPRLRRVARWQEG